MKYRAYFGIKYHEDHRNRDKIDAIAAALQNDGIALSCIARDVEKWGQVVHSPRDLMRITFQTIDESDFVVLEMSEKGVGLGIEAGYAVAKNKLIVVLIKTGLELSNTMQGIADVVITYDRPEEIRISVYNNLLQRRQAAQGD